MIFMARREVREILGHMDDDEIRNVGRIWAEAMANGRRPQVRASRELLGELVGLCHKAAGTRRDLYMWYSL